MEKITTHKTYLVLGSSPKFHIEYLSGTFFERTRTFGMLMLNALRGTFLPLVFPSFGAMLVKGLLHPSPFSQSPAKSP